MKNLVASELRRLHRKVAQADRRLSLMDLPGKVKAGSQDMQARTVRLVIGKTAEGNEILGPPVKWEQQGAGRLKIHSVPKDNEQMNLRSPSGTIGGGSLATWRTYDDENAAPSQSPDEAVLQFGQTNIVLKDDRGVMKQGEREVEISPKFVRGKAGDKARFAASSAFVKIAHGAERAVFVDESGCWSTEPIQIKPQPEPDV